MLKNINILTLRDNKNNGCKYDVWRVVALLYSVCIFLLNFIRIFDNNFWGDECFSIQLSKMSFSDMWYSTAQDVHPPLYYFLLIIVCRLLGYHGWVYHMVSIIPLFIILIFSLTVIWRRFGKEASFLFITLVGISADAVVFNVEIRMYSWAALFTLLAYYGYYKVIKNEKYGELLFVICSLAAAYTHYYALMTVAFLYLGLLFDVIFKRYKLKRLVIVYLSTFLGYVPWLFNMISAYKRTAADFWMKEYPSFIEGVFNFFSSNNKIYSFGMIILVIVLLIYYVVRDVKYLDNIKGEQGANKILLNDNKKELSPTTRWLIWGGITAVGIIAVGEIISVLIRPAFLLRYMYPSVIIIWFMLSVSISEHKYKKVLSLVLVILSLIVYVPMYNNIYTEEKIQAEQCDSTVKLMQEEMGPGDIIVTNDFFMWWTVLGNYFPENKILWMNLDQNITLENDHGYILAWNTILSETEKEKLNNVGLTPIPICEKGIIGMNTVYVYRLIETNY